MERENKIKGSMTEIVSLCLSLDKKAARTYRNLSSCSESEELKHFWNRMSEEEGQHVRFWQHLLKLAEQGLFPQVFDRPEEVAAELRQLDKAATEIVKSSQSGLDVSKSFFAAFRLEFSVAYPAFETLFNYARILKDGIEWNPEDRYERHIDEFIDAFRKHGKGSEEMDLLSDVLGRYWHENRRLAAMSSTDALTGILNRRGFFNVILPLSHLAQRNHFGIGMMILDIDNFKQINDEYGHEKGDEVLVELAKILRGSIRAADILARYGGEEFIVYLSSLRLENIKIIAENLRQKVEQRFVRDKVKVTVSIGVASGTLGEGNVERQITDLINRADACMYEAKKKGKNRVVAGGMKGNC